MELTRKLILTGARAGLTCELRKLSFVDGARTITGPEKEVESLCRYMARVYKAFPEGTTELAQFQAKDKARLAKEAIHGAGKADAEPGPANTVAEVPSNLQSPGAGPAQGAADVGSGADAPATGGTEQHADGDGNRGPDDVFAADQARAIHEAVVSLDPRNDELWTADGKPRIDAVAAAAGKEDLTRKQVEAAVPGFVRPNV